MTKREIDEKMEDISRFASATYKTKFTFFFRDRFGGIHDTDRVIGLFFERVSQDEALWDVSNWGYIHLDDLRVLQS